MQYGWSAPIIPKLQEPDSPVKIEESDIVWLESLLMIGGLIGIPITIYIVDKFGRKISILLASCTTLVSWILLAVARSAATLHLARTLTGIAADVAFVACPMYIAEIADKKIRGFLGSCIVLMMLLGVVIVYSVAPFVSIAATSCVGIAIILTQILVFPLMPESPYFLLKKKKPEQARNSLMKLRNGKDIEEEFREIEEAVDRQEKEKGKFMDLFTVKSNLKAITIMTVLNAAQHLSSISVIVMNLHTILTEAGAVFSPNSVSIYFSVLMLLAASFSGLTVDKTGRKVLLVSSSFLSGICLTIIACYFAGKNSGIEVVEYSWIPMVVVMVYAVVFKLGLGMLPVVLTAELFPTSVKAMGMTLADAMLVIWSTISIFLYQYLANSFGIHVPFFLFAACSVLTGLYVIFCVPETKGKTLDEIQFILKGQKMEMKNISPNP